MDLGCGHGEVLLAAHAVCPECLVPRPPTSSRESVCVSCPNQDDIRIESHLKLVNAASESRFNLKAVRKDLKVNQDEL